MIITHFRSPLLWGRLLLGGRLAALGLGLLVSRGAAREFAALGLPSALRIAIGGAELLGAALFVVPRTRRLGAGLLLLLLSGVAGFHLGVGAEVGRLAVYAAGVTLLIAAERRTALRAPLATSEDRRLLADFEAGRAPEGGFHHREHVRAACLFLLREPPALALQRFCETLRRFAAARGKPQLYHETITWAFLLLVRERMARRGPGASFSEFAERNPDLLCWRPSPLGRYYRDGTLEDPVARSAFLLPDRLAPPPDGTSAP